MTDTDDRPIPVLLLVRPVLITAIGPRAGSVVGQLRQNLPADVPGLALSHLIADESEAEPTDLAAPVTGEKLELVLHNSFRRAALAATDRVSWVTLGWLGEELLGGSEYMEDVLRTVVVPCAASNYLTGRSLTLTMVLVDAAPSGARQGVALLRNLADAVAKHSLAPAAQIYVVRAKRAGGFLLDDDELDAYARLVVRGLVLTNATGVAPEISADVLAARATEVNVAAGSSLGPRLFGRIAVERVKSLGAVIAASCADQRLHEFAQLTADRSAEVPVSWQPAQVTLHRPEFGQADRGRIGAQVRGGLLQQGFCGPPPLWCNRADYMRQIRQDVDGWGKSLEAWQTDVRVQFQGTLRDLRRSSAAERDRARRTIDEQVGTLWADTAVRSPGPHIREFLDIQRKRWTEDLQKLAIGDESIRLSSIKDAQARLVGPLTRLDEELGRRPNLYLMLVFAGLALLIGGWFLWAAMTPLTGILRLTPGLGAELERRAAAVQVGSEVVLLLLVVSIVGGALVLTKVRWDTAYNAIERPITAINQAEARALEHEIQIVDAHWYAKSISAGIDHLEKLTRRLGAVERNLRQVPGPPLRPDVEQSEPFTHLVPENGRAARDRASLLEALTAAEVTRILRAPAFAANWTRGDAQRWTQRARALLRARFATLMAEPSRALETRSAESIRAILADWDGLARTYLSPGTAETGPVSPRAQLVLATGLLAGLISQMRDACGNSTIVRYQSDLDELLLFQAQAGLDATAACT